MDRLSEKANGTRQNGYKRARNTKGSLEEKYSDSLSETN